MRLIDADDMIKSLMDMTYYDDEGHTIHDYEDRLAIVKSFVDSVPTVDAEPVRHGRWIPEAYDDMFCCCSECGTHEYKETIEVLRYDYCPYCGAKMDAEREEE